MSVRSRLVCALACVSVLFAVCAAQAVPIICTNEGWVAGSGDRGWVVQNNNGPAPTLDNPSGYLRITFPGQETPVGGNAQIVANSGSSDGAYVGNYVAPWGVDNIVATFDFYAQDFLPSGLGLYFHSPTSGNTWMYELTVPGATNDWVSYSVGFNTVGAGSAWHTLGTYDLSMLIADLGNVDWIGLYLSRSGETAAELYGFDNFHLHIPEPGSIFMLSAALMSLGVVFRGYLGDSLSKIKALIGRG